MLFHPYKCIYIYFIIIIVFYLFIFLVVVSFLLIVLIYLELNYSISYIFQHPLTFQGECRQLSFPANYMFGNRRLMKHVIATSKVPDFDFCELQCYHQPNCVSINFNVIPVSEGLHECELNNATHRSHGNELLNRDGYIYKGAEVRKCNPLLFFTVRKKKIPLHLSPFYVFVSQIYAGLWIWARACFGFMNSCWGLASHFR